MARNDIFIFLRNSIVFGLDSVSGATNSSFVSFVSTSFLTFSISSLLNVEFKTCAIESFVLLVRIKST